jgi:hypothetical protein
MIMKATNANDPNYIPAYVESTSYAAGGPNHNRLTQEEITRRQLMREVFSRSDSRLGMAHMLEVQRINGGSASGMQTAGTITTQHSEALRFQHIDIIREIMSREEEGSLRMTILEQMLQQQLNPTPNDGSRGTQFWWA